MGNTVRNITININGKEVENSLKAVGQEMKALNKIIFEQKKITLELEREQRRLEQQLRDTPKTQLAAQRALTQELNHVKDAITDQKQSLKELGLEKQKTEGRYRAMTKEIRENSKEINTNKTSLVGLLGAVTGITIGITAVVGMFRQGFRAVRDFTRESIEMAREAQGIEFAFDRLGRAGEEAFDRIRAATRGLVSDLEIRKTVVEFDNLNVSMEQTDALMEFVAIRATQTGDSVENLRKRLISGITSESRQQLQNLGISASDLNEELEKTPDLVTAMSNIAKREVASAGNILDEAANSTGRWNASLQNAQLRLGKLLDQNSFMASLKTLGAAIMDVVFPMETLTDRIREEQIELNVLVNSITDTNISNEDRANLIERLKREYPTFLNFIKDEEITNDNLATALREVNELYIKRIALQSQQDKIEQLLQKSGERTTKVVRAKVEIERELANINTNVLNGALDLTNVSFEKRISLVRAALQENAVFQTSSTGNRQTLNAEAQALNSLNSLIEKNNLEAGRRNKVTDQTIEEQQMLQEMEAALGITLSQLNEMFGVNSAAKRENVNATRELTTEEQKLLNAQQKAQEALDAFLAKERESRDLGQMEGLTRELAMIDIRYNAQIERAKQFGLDITELEEAQRLARHDAEVDAILRQEERIKELEEEARLLREEEEFERELLKEEDELVKEELRLERARELALAELERLEEEELAKVEVVENAEALKAAIREKYAAEAAKVNREFDTAERNLRQDQVKWTALTEQQKLNIIVGALAGAADAFNEGTAAWKAIKIAETLITTYQSAQNAFNALSGIPIVGPALGAVAAGLAVVAGLKRVQTISKTEIQQMPKPKATRVKGYYEGGYTGTGAIGYDQDGPVTGYVHQNEWVAPAHMTQSPKYANTIQWLEQERQRNLKGYFEGGPVTSAPEGADTQPQDTSRLESLMAAMIERLENPVPPVLNFGYEDEQRRQDIENDIQNSRNKGILTP